MRGKRDALKTRHVGGEAGHRDASMPDATDQRRQATPNIRLRSGMPLHQRVGAVANHGQHTAVAKLLERRLVGRRSDQRLGVKFPVASVHDRPMRGRDRQGLRLGDGVRHAQKAQRERRQLERPAGRDHMQLHLVEQARLAELAPQHRRSERRRIDRAA